MSESTEYVPPTEVAGSFADLGLENPGSYELPVSGLPVGTHQAFVKSARFVQHRTDARKKNLELVYEVNEPQSPSFGKTAKETKPANSFDSAQSKGYLVQRLNELGVPTSEIPSLDLKTLVGKPIYLTIRPPREAGGWTQVGSVSINTDGQFVSVPQPPVGNGVPANVPQANNLGY